MSKSLRRFWPFALASTVREAQEVAEQHARAAQAARDELTYRKQKHEEQLEVLREDFRKLVNRHARTWYERCAGDPSLMRVVHTFDPMLLYDRSWTREMVAECVAEQIANAILHDVKERPSNPEIKPVTPWQAPLFNTWTP
jgi:hypothetical protein